MEVNFSQPVQCSEDRPEQHDQSEQPDQRAEIPPSLENTRVDVVPDIQPDAERVGLPGAGERLNEPQHFRQRPGQLGNTQVMSERPNEPPVAGNRPRENIVISGNSGSTIQVEGLAAVLDPGGIYRMGYSNHMDVFHLGSSKKTKNKYKLTESSAEPVIGHLDVISAGLAKDWVRLGTQLGLPEATLKQIELQYQPEGQHEVNYRMLLCWKQKVGRVTLKMLAKALADIGRGDLADELRTG